MGKRKLLIEGKHNFEERGCDDCLFNETSITCWCVNKQAIYERGTADCGMKQCPFWQPCTRLEELPKQNWLQRLFHDERDRYEHVKGIKE